MRVRFVCREDGVIVERGRVYDVLSTGEDWFRVLIGDGVESYHPASALDVMKSGHPAPKRWIREIVFGLTLNWNLAA